MATEVRRVRFTQGSFHADLKHRIEAYFEGSGRSRHGGAAMGLKSATMLGWLFGSWGVLVFAPVNGWQAALLAISVGLAMAGVGFSVMHDANHGGYSKSPRVNRIMSFTLDLVGASSAIWRQKHNVMHHTYTNVSGLDSDIESGSPMLRLAPWQPRLRAHRFQHLYVWLLYGLFPIQWWFLDDMSELVTGKVAGQKFPPARGRRLVGALAGKAVFIAWTLVIPLALHPWWVVLSLWFLAIFVLGNVLASTFQLAHCVGQAEFHKADAGQEMKDEWAVHQVNTTVDFARRNRLLGWYMGGLNFQVEHHLFPKVCHLHYPAISRIVEETCAAHGIRYRDEPTLRSALRSNFRWLKQMGSPSPA
jgi:linoleoyl-CoA desaturase